MDIRQDASSVVSGGREQEVGGHEEGVGEREGKKGEAMGLPTAGQADTAAHLYAPSLAGRLPGRRMPQPGKPPGLDPAVPPVRPG